jgi:hypothetical protein
MEINEEPVCKVYKMDKNAVYVYKDHVRKIFKQDETGNSAKMRFFIEQEALRRLEDVQGVPKLLKASESPELCLTMSRLPGRPLSECEQVPDQFFLDLKSIVCKIIERGIECHPLKPRDLIVGPNGEAGIIDFERVRIRGSRFKWGWIHTWVMNRLFMSYLILMQCSHLMNVGKRVLLRLVIGSYKLSRLLREWLKRALKSNN